jgi:GAF domain-containing protein
VLDRPQRSRFSLAEMELLGLFASQAAIALDLLLHGRRARAALDRAGGDSAVLARVAAALDSLEGRRREAGGQLLAALEQILAQ